MKKVEIGTTVVTRSSPVDLVRRDFVIRKSADHRTTKLGVPQRQKPFTSGGETHVPFNKFPLAKFSPPLLPSNAERVSLNCQSDSRLFRASKPRLWKASHHVQEKTAKLRDILVFECTSCVREFPVRPTPKFCACDSLSTFDSFLQK